MLQERGHPCHIGFCNLPPATTAFCKVRKVGSRVPRDRVSRRQSAPFAQTIPPTELPHAKSPLQRHLSKSLSLLKRVTHKGSVPSDSRTRKPSRCIQRQTTPSVQAPASRVCKRWFQVLRLSCLFLRGVILPYMPPVCDTAFPETGHCAGGSRSVATAIPHRYHSRRRPQFAALPHGEPPSRRRTGAKDVPSVAWRAACSRP